MKDSRFTLIAMLISILLMGCTQAMQEQIEQVREQADAVAQISSVRSGSEFEAQLADAQTDAWSRVPAAAERQAMNLCEEWQLALCAWYAMEGRWPESLHEIVADGYIFHSVARTDGTSWAWVALDEKPEHPMRDQLAVFFHAPGDVELCLPATLGRAAAVRFRLPVASSHSSMADALRTAFNVPGVSRNQRRDAIRWWLFSHALQRTIGDHISVASKWPEAWEPLLEEIALTPLSYRVHRPATVVHAPAAWLVRVSSVPDHHVLRLQAGHSLDALPFGMNRPMQQVVQVTSIQPGLFRSGTLPLELQQQQEDLPWREWAWLQLLDLHQPETWRTTIASPALDAAPS